MRKKPYTRAPDPREFRESDFAGMQPRVQAELSHSLNRLSEQLATARQALNQIAPAAELPGAPEPGSAAGPDQAAPDQADTAQAAKPPADRTTP